MARRFDERATTATRALQVWQILIARATNRQTIIYGSLSVMMGRGGPQNLRSFLNPIANYCRANELPPLTITVVNSDGSLSDTSYISDNIRQGTGRGFQLCLVPNHAADHRGVRASQQSVRVRVIRTGLLMPCGSQPQNPAARRGSATGAEAAKMKCAGCRLSGA